MRRPRAAGLVMAGLAALAALGQDVVWPFVQAIGRHIAAWPPLAPLRRRVARLPAVLALPLFLVPESCSRFGTLVSAWLLLQGDGWRALGVYAGSKLVAGAVALWIYTACEPALLQIKLFAAMHRALASLRRAALDRLRGRNRVVPPP